MPSAVRIDGRAQAPIARYWCPGCGTLTDQALKFIVERCNIWQCSGCGLGRTEAPAFNPDSYYTDAYFSGQRSDGYADYVGAESVLRREFASTVRFIRRFCREGRLIELGCAYGFFLQEARRFFDASGIELAQTAAEHARRAGLKVLSGAADEVNLRQLGPADVIVLLDVIEHLPDPRGTLAICERFLNPGGIIVLTTGDFKSVLAQVSGASWRLMTPPQHLWFFTKQSLCRIADSLGLKLEHTDHPWKLVPLSLISFQLRRMLRLRPVPSKATPLCLPINLFDAMRMVFRKSST
jgi:SAM-dependent methyltransferase